MKKYLLLIFAICIMLAGCSGSSDKPAVAPISETQASADTIVEVNNSSDVAQELPGVTIYPLPDTTMENLNDAILPISLKDGDAYVDDTGKMQMSVKIYGYDKYDMVDIAMLKVGDILVTNAGEVVVISVEHMSDGSVSINGGLDAGGLELVTENNGIFYEQGFNDAKNWHEVGEAIIRVSVDFQYYDASDLDKGEIVYYPGDFVVGAITDYNFYPHNTSIRVEAGQIVEMHRVYVP